MRVPWSSGGVDRKKKFVSGKTSRGHLARTHALLTLQTLLAKLVFHERLRLLTANHDVHEFRVVYVFLTHCILLSSFFVLTPGFSPLPKKK